MVASGGMVVSIRVVWDRGTMNDDFNACCE